MSRTLVEIKRAQIEKDRTMAETTAEQEAIVKLKKLNGELLYTQNDLDEVLAGWDLTDIEKSAMAGRMA